MRKSVSSAKGYSIFLERKNDEDNIKCTAYITGDHMTGQEIADELDITRVAVSQIIKRSIKSIYGSIRHKFDCNPVEAVCLMANLFNVNSEEQYNKFFKLFPPEIKGEVRYDAFKTT